MSFFKSQLSFPLNFASPFSAVTHNFSEILYLKHYMRWTKGVHQNANFQTFDYSHEN